MTDKYRHLNAGEIVLATDEYLDDTSGWVTAVGSVGQPAPDPRYTSHRKFRRRISETDQPIPEAAARKALEAGRRLLKAQHEKAFATGIEEACELAREALRLAEPEPDNP